MAVILAGALGIVSVSFTVLVSVTGTRVHRSPAETVALCALMAAIGPGGVLLGAWGQRCRIARFGAQCAQVVATPFAKELAALRDRQKRLIARLLAEPTTDRRFARVLCCEPILMPEVGDSRFEPFISRTGLPLGWPLLFVGGTGGLWAISYLFPGIPIVTPIGRFAGVLVLAGGVPVVVLALFDLLFRTRYVRIAPGQIDILTYSFFHRTPRWKRIPLDANTVVFFRSAKDNVRLFEAEIVREGKTLRVQHFPGQPPGAAEHVWWAVHAPYAPLPLPTDALTG